MPPRMGLNIILTWGSANMPQLTALGTSRSALQNCWETKALKDTGANLASDTSFVQMMPGRLGQCELARELAAKLPKGAGQWF